jgi:hypothetical protein
MLESGAKAESGFNHEISWRNGLAESDNEGEGHPFIHKALLACPVSLDEPPHFPSAEGAIRLAGALV